MYFDSSSWGKLGKVISKATDNPYYESIDMDNVSKLLNDITEKGFKQPKTRVDIMKELLGGLRMPVLNPKTGEQDHVDIKLVSKVVIDSEYVEDIKSNNKYKVDVTIVGDESTNQVNISVLNKDLSIAETEIIELQLLEEMLYKALNEIKSQRIEEVVEFKSIIDELMDRSVESARVDNQNFYARLNKEYVLQDGIGIIRDTKTNQDIGTFESLEYTYSNDKRVANIEGIFLSGRAFGDLKESDRYEFTFYSLDHSTSYSVLATNNSKVKTDEGAQAYDLSKFSLVIEKFDQEHNQYKVITNANQFSKNNYDEDHPLYDKAIQEFTSSRLAILEESKTQQKQQKLLSQFADIDLDI